MPKEKLQSNSPESQALDMARQTLGRVKEMDLTPEEKGKVMAMIDEAKGYEKVKQLSKALNAYNKLKIYLEKIKSPEMPYEYEQRVISFLADLQLKYKLSQYSVLSKIMGFESEQAWEIRRKYAKSDEEIDRRSVIKSLVGLDDEESWELRNKLEGSLDYANSLAGLDSEKAWLKRKELFSSPDSYDIKFAMSLAGIDSPQAWNHRNDYLESDACSENIKSKIIEGLAGLDTPQAWKIRNEYVGSLPKAVIASLAGLDSERAWQIRRQMLAERKNPQEILTSLVGLDSEDAWKFRSTYLQEYPINKRNKEITRYPVEILHSLAYVNSDKAWQWRLQAKKDPDQLSVGEVAELIHCLVGPPSMIGVWNKLKADGKV